MAKSVSIKFSQLAAYIYVITGSIPGALIRFLFDNDFILNIIGAGIFGFIMGLPDKKRSKIFFGVGFCGALTTFSTWMVDCFAMIHKGDFIQALLLILLSLVFGLLFMVLGFAFARKLTLKGFLNSKL